MSELNGLSPPNKLAAVYHVHELASRLDRVDVVAFNPGFVPGTSLARNADPVSRFLMVRVLPLLSLTPLATRPKTAGRDLANVVLGRTTAPIGSHVDRAVADRSSNESYEASREAELWDALENLTAARPARGALKR